MRKINHHYKNHSIVKTYWYLVSYSYSKKFGNGFGSIELQITGKLNFAEIRDYILNNNEEFAQIVILNTMRTKKVKKI